MEKTIIKKLASEKEGVFTFEMIGFNEIYKHDLKNNRVSFIQKGFGIPRASSTLIYPLNFDQFVSFAKVLFKTRISKGNGLKGNIKDLDPNCKLDLGTIALSSLAKEREG